MERVRGLLLTSYCDQAQFPPAEAGDLSECGLGGTHTHQKGIIHRDLKPSNVLVASQEGKPVVKVIDFGIAKVLSGPLTDKTLVTGLTQMIGTPLYMSPEQAGEGSLDVDTRSDVYSLGVVLYELLTGVMPMERKWLKEVSLLEMLRLVREQDPPRPSSRLGITEQLPSIAANRGLEPRRLSGLLRGELDWIVMKALEKDRNRRYETANGLAMDVRRYLADEPVLACPPSAGYRLRKFARKYRKVLLTAAAFVLVLILGVAMQTVSLMQIDAARRKAQGKEQKTKKALNTLRVGNVANLWFSADGTELFTITAEDRGLRYWDATRSLAPRSRRISNTPVCGVAFHPNGKELVCVGFDRVIRRLDRQLDAEPVVLGMATELLRAAAYAPEGNLLAVVGDSSALLLDPADGRVLSKLGERGRSVLRSLAWFPDGKGLALAGGWRPFRGNPLQGDMSIWSAETREVLQRFQAGEEVVETVACRPNGKYLAAGSGRFLPEADQPHGTVTIWDTTTGTVLHRLRHSFAVRALAFSPDSKVLASAGINQQKPTEAILWNMATGQEILRASGHSRGIISLTFHPDGRRLVTASMDRTIKVWDTVTGMELLTFTEHPRSLTCVHFSADGNLLASADASGTVFIWEGTPQ